jgi:hypothetical protein
MAERSGAEPAMGEILVAVFEGAGRAARVLEELRPPAADTAELAEACTLRRDPDGRLRLEVPVGAPERRRLPHGFWHRLVEQLLGRTDGPPAAATHCFGRPFCEAVAEAVGRDRSAILLHLEEPAPPWLPARLEGLGARLLRAQGTGSGQELGRRLEEALIEVPPARELARTARTVETERLLQARARQRAAQEARRLELERLQAEELEPAELAAAIRRCAEAARRGARRALVLSFPAELLEDRGRRILQHEPDWPASLTGRPRAFHRLFKGRLAPLGYRLEAEVTGFEDGVPAAFGLFLAWSGDDPGAGLEQAEEPLAGGQIAP